MKLNRSVMSYLNHSWIIYPTKISLTCNRVCLMENSERVKGTNSWRRFYKTLDMPLQWFYFERHVVYFNSYFYNRFLYNLLGWLKCCHHYLILLCVLHIFFLGLRDMISTLCCLHDIVNITGFGCSNSKWYLKELADDIACFGIANEISK